MLLNIKPQTSLLPDSCLLPLGHHLGSLWWHLVKATHDSPSRPVAKGVLQTRGPCRLPPGRQTINLHLCHPDQTGGGVSRSPDPYPRTWRFFTAKERPLSQGHTDRHGATPQSEADPSPIHRRWRQGRAAGSPAMPSPTELDARRCVP